MSLPLKDVDACFAIIENRLQRASFVYFAVENLRVDIDVWYLHAQEGLCCVGMLHHVCGNVLSVSVHQSVCTRVDLVLREYVSTCSTNFVFDADDSERLVWMHAHRIPYQHWY